VTSSQKVGAERRVGRNLKGEGIQEHKKGGDHSYKVGGNRGGGNLYFGGGDTDD